MQQENSKKGHPVALALLGVFINVAGARLARAFALPLYLDSIGTVLSAAAGGYFPGIVVGFASNVLNSADDPITLYYGIISVLMAAATAFFAARGAFRSFFRSLALVPALSLLGGALGSVMTWLLYGFNIGEGISAQLSRYFWQTNGFPKFWAQFAADMLLDVPDKLLTVAAVFLLLRLLPKRVWEWLSPKKGAVEKRYRRFSLYMETIGIILSAGILIGVSSVAVSFVLYRDTCRERYAEIAAGITETMARQLPADRIDAYLETGVKDAEYEEALSQMKELQKAFPKAKYLYVYQIHPDGCHVVFDLDTPDLPGSKLGTVMAFDKTFEPYLDALLSGGEIGPVESDDQFGYLLTVYRAVRDSSGKCVAYACVDVQMDEVLTDQTVYTIRLISLIFAVLTLMCLLTIRQTEKRMVEPINRMTKAAEDFAYESEEERRGAKAQFEKLNIRTGNELESLYHAMYKTVADMADYIDHVNAQAVQIARMQTSMISTLADIVESRDENTGEHIRRTAAYVEILARSLQRRGVYPELLTDSYIADMRMAAPLHDVGKIQISDAVLNKPGKLTEQEFEVMKTHAAVGKALLMNVADDFGSFSYLAIAVEMAGCHHEWWNGAGYPGGLSGEDVPLCARIMAVADVFDALISKRSYKAALPVERAFAILEEERGTHFDPACIDAFLAAADEVRAVTQEPEG